VVAQSPKNPRQHDLGLRLRAELRAPFHAFRINDAVLRAESEIIARLERKGGVGLRRELLAANSPEQIAWLAARIAPEHLHLVGRRGLLRCANRDSTAACGDEQYGRKNSRGDAWNHDTSSASDVPPLNDVR